MNKSNRTREENYNNFGNKKIINKTVLTNSKGCVILNV